MLVIGTDILPHHPSVVGAAVKIAVCGKRDASDGDKIRAAGVTRYWWGKHGPMVERALSEIRQGE